MDNPYKVIWENLEDFLKAYQDLSEKHKAIYLSVKKSRLNALQIDNTNNRSETKKNQNKGLNEPYETEINYELYYIIFRIGFKVFIFKLILFIF